MKVLILNCGSSSVKFQLINVETTQVLASGVAERVGEDLGLFSYVSEKYTKKKREMLLENHTTAINLILETLQDAYHGVIGSYDEIDAVGHRAVHGAEFFSDSVRLDKKVLDCLQECVEIAPLHNPANILGIEAITKLMPATPQVLVFDTAFHQTMPPKAYLYPIPYEYYEDYKIRRYGFHGTSHKYVAGECAKYLGRPLEELKLIICHIGNGASITAVDGGKSVDTSMGYTPLEGLMMGTRCGDIDPALPLIMQTKFGLTAENVNNILNKKSGMLGLSQLTNDMREIEEEVLEHKHEKAIVAHEVYAYKIRKYIGSYMAVLNGCDAVVFTGGVGENMPILRETVCKDMEFLGIELDFKENNQFKGGILELSTAASKVKVFKIPTNEELMIALETKKVLSK